MLYHRNRIPHQWESRSEAGGSAIPRARRSNYNTNGMVTELTIYPRLVLAAAAEGGGTHYQPELCAKITTAVATIAR